ncbi:MAG: hypothetical protein ACI909_003815 [Planctomycetota bacterium]|jgi:hypothetical protein
MKKGAMSEIYKTNEIVQIAYFVKDVEVAARKAHETLGIGPFFIYKNIELVNVTYRGNETELDHTSAYGQSGSLMIEFCQQNDTSRSAFSDMYPDGGEGIHHAAMFVDSVSEEMRRFKTLGHETVTHYFTRDGNVEVAFVDTRNLYGHMIELYEPTEALTGFYSSVRKAANEWDRKELFRYLN